MNAVSQNEIVAHVIQPHFDAIRDEFVKFHGDNKLKRTRFVVDDTVHNSKRHFAMTRDDGLHMCFAPQIIELPQETFVAILTHEFGHASDFAYPTRWISPDQATGEALWISEEKLDTKQGRSWKKLWQARSRDHIEWAADAIVKTVIGKSLRYSGDCLLQTFGNGIKRPEGLR